MYQHFYDVIIIGAGPAGLSTALYLQKYLPDMTGKMLVLEKATFPRDKLCGGGLTMDAEVLLQDLGLDVNELPYIISEQILIKTSDVEFSYKNLARKHTLRIIRRIDLDHFLLQNTRNRGILVKENTKVTAIDPAGELVVLETSQGRYSSRFIVLAEGSNGILSSKIFPDRRARKARLLEVFLPADSGQPDHPIFDFSPILDGIHGYLWSFPSPSAQNQSQGSLRNFGVMNTRGHHSDPTNLPDYFQRSFPTSVGPIPLGQIKSHPILLFDPHHRNQAGPVISVGDCAGVDPLFGEGISFALGSGQLAARAIVDAIRSGSLQIQNYQRRIIHSPLGRSLFLRWFIAAILFRLRSGVLQLLIWKVLDPLVRFLASTILLGWAEKLQPRQSYHELIELRKRGVFRFFSNRNER